MYLVHRQDVSCAGWYHLLNTIVGCQQAHESPAVKLGKESTLHMEDSSSGQELTSVPIPDIANSVPSICEAVLGSNLRCMPLIAKPGASHRLIDA